VLLSSREIWGLRRWESLLFDASLLSLPICGVLFWISVTRIKSVCIMCSIVYGVIVLLVLLLGLANRRRIGALVTEGPKELFRWLSSVKVGAGFSLICILFLSQVYWMPKLLQAGAAGAVMYGREDGSTWAGHPTFGLNLGSTKAPIFIEEFTDYQCPFCGMAHEVMMQVLHKFPGKIHLIHRDYPLDNACHPELKRPFHPNACEAAYYGRCAARQGRYWPMEAHLFHNREKLDKEHLDEYARKVGLDMDKLASCLKDPQIREAVVKDIKEGIQREVKGTPTIFINGEKIVGKRTAEFWEAKIKKLLDTWK
jgi:protein-disulfide isomerase